MSFIPFLETENQMQGLGGSGLLSLVPLLGLFVIMYIFIIRPQSKKQKETQKMINSLKKGDNVITIGGIHGTVSSVKDNTIIVKVDENTKIEFNRTAIATVQKSEAELAEEAAKAAEAKEAKKAKKEKKADRE
ncbi:MAG: preprotein translocase subunit YajC [Treponema sp.]|nr:preprotein translocase subunit YajC [Treponema sp.]